MRDELVEIWGYSRWANALLLESCALLPAAELSRDLGSSFPSILATLSHMAAAERIWLARWRGLATGTETPIPPPALTFQELRAQWSRSWEDYDRFLSTVTDPDCRTDITYRTSRGEQFTSPLWKLIRHVVNHATHHRGQVITMLRQLGHAAPNTDLIRYFREH